MATETVTYRGFDLDITFDYCKGYIGSLEEPPEPESIDIEKVERVISSAEIYEITGEDFQAIEIDITELLGETQFSEIEEKLWEVKRDYDGD